MSLRDELQAVYERHGKLTPRIVVAEAADESSPLHSRLEWDDKVAGHAWRLHQAHELIRSVRVAYLEADGRRSDVRAFHAVPSTDGGFEYRSAEDIARDEVLTQVLLREMERDIAQLKSRWGHFKEFATLLREAVA